MKVILLAGGFGTRLAEYTEVLPKPMVSIGGQPILWHIMQLFADYDHKNFYIACGYKAEVIKQYFLSYPALNADFSINLATGQVTTLMKKEIDWQVSVIYTGINSMTGGRVKRLQSLIGNETCFLTYGDGLANINLDDLLAYHRSHSRMVTVTAVRPSARFGELEICDGQVISFQEKPQVRQGWINGGFFVIEPEFFDLIPGEDTVLEAEPLEKAAALGELMAYQHEGFWQCMDTKRDRDLLENLWQSGKAPWKR
ncbi:glucose-1-phosphate cytidylyltransferase [Cylindrospermopsis raciborskii CHAB3438]|uniref:glucose-1-phosphate cytidylyltransferase n=1 Tax=Cylindrospermopsis raciborskii TaxID=77022 RepID=UPI000B61CADD|nr:glucose-1-phosphate cytidylyltransferase [Cylindrospermopsis raciborskii]MCH4903868.1 glucose-1-phosphate cytidylyltransferase [Cylindrospermopsis raciborskii CHAB3438]BAZ91352.1 glucose-1-phosphate cytidylyltransferase [Raphidiopsis curvata NIES-932]